VPQDISGLMKLLGGPDSFVEKLDELFSTTSGLSGRQQADITGLIGQYAHGNEPSHHVAYLYNYAGQPYRTQELVRQIMEELYGAQPDGLCGNEDCGQMSAWFVMSAMGFYPVTPGDGKYIIGSPLFEEVTIDLPAKKQFTIKALNNSSQNIYIQSATLNGQEYNRSFLLHTDLISGGTMEFTMDDRPQMEWGSQGDGIPLSSISDHIITPVPYFNKPSKTFRDKLALTISHIDPEAEISYYYGAVSNSKKKQLYKDTLVNTNSFKIAATARVEDTPASNPAPAFYRKMDNRWSVRLKYPYSTQYTGGGDLALVDGETGGANFHTGGWQGYHGTDFEALIDFGRIRTIRSINARFLDDQNSWIFLPVEVEISVSDKPYDFKVITLINNPVGETDHPSIQVFKRTGLPLSARYVKVRAKNIGICPEWHKGAGGKAWLFIDEIEVE
jgi:hypothetical protein